MTVSLFGNSTYAGLIIYDTFSRNGSLHGSTPDTSPGTSWNVPIAGHTTDGSVLNMDGGLFSTRANIGFTLVPGLIYTLSVEVDVDEGGGDLWMNAGFTDSLTESFSIAASNYAWMLIRSDSSNAQTFAGPATVGGANYTLDPFTNAGVMKIELDTSNLANYSATWFYNDVELGTASIGAPAITGIFLGDFFQTGTFDNLQLTETAPVPEPGSILAMLSLISFGAGAVVLRRRRVKGVAA